MNERKMEIYHVNRTYLEGWYTLEDLKRIIETAERIDKVNKDLAEDANFQMMDETIPVPEVGWMTLPKA